MKTELLVQMDGLARTDDLVFVLAATNLPWELDQAMLRRLEKRIWVDLPCLAARRKVLNDCLADRVAAGVDLEPLAEQLAGYSGSDLTLVAKEAAMQPLRRLMAALDGAEGAGAAEVGAVEARDIERAVRAVKSTAHKHSAAYAKFAAEFGSQLGGP